MAKHQGQILKQIIDSQGIDINEVADFYGITRQGMDKRYKMESLKSIDIRNFCKKYNVEVGLFYDDTDYFGYSLSQIEELHTKVKSLLNDLDYSKKEIEFLKNELMEAKQETKTAQQKYMGLLERLFESGSLIASRVPSVPDPLGKFRALQSEAVYVDNLSDFVYDCKV